MKTIKYFILKIFIMISLAVGSDLISSKKWLGGMNRRMNLEKQIRFVDQNALAISVKGSEEETAPIKTKKKGKHAYATENRRLVWKYIVWPLILQVNRQY